MKGLIPSHQSHHMAHMDGRTVTLVPISKQMIDEKNEFRASGIRDGQSYPARCYLSSNGHLRFTEIVSLDDHRFPVMDTAESEVQLDDIERQRWMDNEYWQVFDEDKVLSKLETENTAAIKQQRDIDAQRASDTNYRAFGSKLNQYIYDSKMDSLPDRIVSHSVPAAGHLYKTGVTSAIGGKGVQQDHYVASPLLSTSYQFFAVFDGHGDYGDKCSQGAAKHLPSKLQNRLKHNLPKLTPLVAERAALKSAFVDTRLTLMDDDNGTGYNDGTTACSVLLKGNRILAANAGDSRAIVINRNGEVTQLTEDQKAGNMRFRSSVTKRKGFVARDLSESRNPPERVGKMSEPTRGLGDGFLFGISGRPKVTSYDLPNTGSGHTVVLASDGVWDLATAEQIGELVHFMRKQGKSAEEISNAIIKLCLATARQLQKDTGFDYGAVADNMIAMVIFPNEASTLSSKETEV